MKCAMLLIGVMLAIAFGLSACDSVDVADENIDSTDDDDDTGADDDAADDDATDDDTGDTIRLSQAVTVVPSDGLPAEVNLQNANNNLDVVRFDNRVFMAWRTAPTHFASDIVELWVASSEDEVHWIFELNVFQGRDLREPRFLAWNGRLFLYFAFLGTNSFDFEPGGMMVTERLGEADWTEPEPFYGEGFIPWRTKVIDGVPYMLTYIGGGNIYDVEPEPIDVHWLTTGDGVNWIPVVPGQPVVLSGGVSETDFVFLDDGTLVAVSRNELGDSGGFGSKICRADADDLGDWQCVDDPKKYDSPLVFKHHNDVYLIGRRNLNNSGDYDLGWDWYTQAVQHLLYELDYWTNLKRCSLWRVHPEDLTVTWVLDLPSRGDTCFAGLLENEDGDYTVYNYTNAVDGPDLVWVKGQLSPTIINRMILHIP